MEIRIFCLPLWHQKQQLTCKMSKLNFTKMHGAGNDYIYINCMKSCPADLPALSRRLSDRHTGVGADGMVLIMPSEIADFRMRMFNADGSEGLMCGNAARCVGKYVFEKGLTDKKRIALETPSGVRTLCLHFDGTAVDRVTVDMGCPVLEPSRIPVHSSCAEDIEIATSFGATALTAVSMGNPHGVVFCKLADVNVEGLGKELETNAVFPDRANIEFVEVAAPDSLLMRVWERGSGETQACGSGACAAVVAGVLTGRCARHCSVSLPGGCLDVEWREADNKVYLTGPAQFVFEGTVDV